eukprot:4794913-Amphidinium_carterae.3
MKRLEPLAASCNAALFDPPSMACAGVCIPSLCRRSLDCARESVKLLGAPERNLLSGVAVNAEHVFWASFMA